MSMWKEKLGFAASFTLVGWQTNLLTALGVTFIVIAIAGIYEKTA